MEPRRAKGKWTPLPKDYVRQVLAALKDSFRDELRSGKFVVEGRIYATELMVRMGYLESGHLRQRNFEMSIDYQAGKDGVLKLLNLAVDVGATLLEDLFSRTEEDADFPRQWTSYDVEGKKVWVQFTTNNTELDQQADAILGADKPGLVSDNEEESLEGIKARLGLDEESDDEDPSDGDGGEGSDPIKH